MIICRQYDVRFANNSYDSILNTLKLELKKYYKGNLKMAVMLSNSNIAFLRLLKEKKSESLSSINTSEYFGPGFIGCVSYFKESRK